MADRFCKIEWKSRGVTKCGYLTPVFLALCVITAQSADRLARSPAQTNVQAAIAAAAAGDRVLIPAGTATWTGKVKITKAIAVIGAGAQSGGTRIENISGSSSKHPWTFNVNLAKDGPVRISGIYFYDATPGEGRSNNGVRAGSNSKLFQTQVRIDHCVFERCFWALGMFGSFGVCDHNRFINVNKCARTAGYLTMGGRAGSYATYYPVPFDSLHYMVYEDNTGEWGPNWSHHYNYFSGEAGCSYVVRKSSFRMSGRPDAMMDPVDLHGNFPNYCGRQRNSDTGLSVQVYDNVFTYSPGNGRVKLADIRGGQAQIYDNVVKGRNAYIQLREEDANPTLNTRHCPIRQTLENVWIWNNIQNDETVLPVHAAAMNGAGTAFLLDVNYHLTRPINVLAPPYPHPLASSKTEPKGD